MVLRIKGWSTDFDWQPWTAEECRLAAVVSHISRKTSEMWGTQGWRSGQNWDRRVLTYPLKPNSLRAGSGDRQMTFGAGGNLRADRLSYLDRGSRTAKVAGV
jgi:hypothetical protein